MLPQARVGLIVPDRGGGEIKDKNGPSAMDRNDRNG